MSTEPDDMFTRAGAAVFLTSTDEIGSGRYSHPPRLPVYFGDYPRPVYVTADDLTCVSCGGGFDFPDRRPIKWLAANKLLNDGLCRSCDA